jgi:hypothetical protein
VVENLNSRLRNYFFLRKEIRGVSGPAAFLHELAGGRADAAIVGCGRRMGRRLDQFGGISWLPTRVL